MVTVDHVNLADERSYDEFFAVYRSSHDRDFDVPSSRNGKRVELVDSGRYYETAAIVARDPVGQPTAVGSLQLPLADNLELAYVTIEVRPERRREGFGSAVLHELMILARAAGRSRAFAEARWGLLDDPAVPRVFFESHGFVLDLLDAQRDLALPAKLPDAPLDPAYRLATWRGKCPTELVDSYARLRSLMVQEAPSGDIGFEPEVWDGDRVRHEEQTWVKQGRDTQVTVAIGPDGSLAGHTQIVVPRDDRETAYQWDTLVLPAHRGRRLGLALKVHNHHAAADLLIGRRRVTTE
ncbi:MAG: hypothetical protein JWP10_602, partial [Nocardioidaceae bacterium]|nr:hypothetical protein [Nocardioidaceae bacterium]